MTLIQEVWLIAETQKVRGASSDSKRMELEIRAAGQVVKRKLGDAPGDNYQPGRADIWQFDMADEQISQQDLEPGSFRLTNPSRDGWLPKSFFIIGKLENGEFVVLLGNPNWPAKWFDSDSSSGQQSSTSWPLNER